MFVTGKEQSGRCEKSWGKYLVIFLGRRCELRLPCYHFLDESCLSNMCRIWAQCRDAACTSSLILMIRFLSCLCSCAKNIELPIMVMLLSDTSVHHVSFFLLPLLLPSASASPPPPPLPFPLFFSFPSLLSSPPSSPPLPSPLSGLFHPVTFSRMSGYVHVCGDSHV